MKHYFLVFISFFAFSLTSLAQEEKDVEIALRTYQKDKMKGIAKMEKILANSTNSKYWDVLVKMYYEIHLSTGGNPDTSTAFKNFITTCRWATLRSRSTLGSFYLRTYITEKEPDIKNETLKLEFTKADALLKEKKINEALAIYKKISSQDTSSLRAKIYTGNCFRLLKMPDSAISAYYSAIRSNADQVDAWKGVVNAMIDKEDFVFVIEKTIYGLIAYPDEELYDNFYFLLNKQHKILNRNWMPRKYSINTFDDNSTNETILESPWNIYRKSKDEIKPYCNADGLIIKKNHLTKQKYAELYAWEQMLKQTSSARITYFDTARKMQAAGFLDCYIFFSLFHVDFYKQYKSFSIANKDKLKNYIETYAISK